MIPNLPELLVVLVVVLLLFGAGRIPKLAEDFGKGIRAFKKGLKEDDKGTETLPTSEDDKKDAE